MHTRKARDRGVPIHPATSLLGVGPALTPHAQPSFPMSTFDPDRPSRVHDRINDETFDWRTG